MFRKNLRYLRIEHDMEQAELGKKLERGATSVSNWEKGVSIPNASVISKISKIFNVSMTDLMERDLSQPLENDTEKRFDTIVAHISEDLSEEQMEKIIDYIELLKNSNK